MAETDGVVSLAHLSLRELCRQRRMGVLRLRHQEQTGRVPIEAMHDTRPLRGPALGTVAEMVEDAVNHRTMAMPWGRVHDETRGLVDHQEVVVFEDEVQDDGFGF